MNTKAFSLILLATILLSMSAVSASLVDVSAPQVLSQSANTTYFTVTANEDVTLSMTHPTLQIADAEGRLMTLALAPTTLGALTAGNSQRVDVALSVDEDFDFDLGTYNFPAITVTAANATATESNTVTVSYVESFCKYGNIGSLEITELDDRTIDNEDEWIWHPLDNVEFRVETFNGFPDKEKISVEYQLYDEDGKKVDLGSDDDSISVSIGDDEDERVTFTLRVPADIDEGNYKLYVKAFLKSDEDVGCTDKGSVFSNTYYQKVSIEKEDDRAVVVDISKLDAPDTAMCGDTVTVYAKLYNVGTEDEDQVLVNLFNSELGLDMDKEVSNLDAGDGDTVSFNFVIPKDAAEKAYTLRFITYYDYDSDDDFYDSNSKDDLEKDMLYSLRVTCLPKTAQSASISAELASDAIAGERLVIKGTLENTGDSETDYTISVIGNSDWSALDRVEPSTVTLDAGQTRDFYIYLDVNEDAVGENSFTIQANYGTKSTEQPVAVVIEGKTAGLTGGVIGASLRENWFIWLIVLINIVLIIAIILVARRIVATR